MSDSILSALSTVSDATVGAAQTIGTTVLQGADQIKNTLSGGAVAIVKEMLLAPIRPLLQAVKGRLLNLIVFILSIFAGLAYRGFLYENLSTEKNVAIVAGFGTMAVVARSTFSSHFKILATILSGGISVVLRFVVMKPLRWVLGLVMKIIRRILSLGLIGLVMVVPRGIYWIVKKLLTKLKDVLGGRAGGGGESAGVVGIWKGITSILASCIVGFAMTAIVDLSLQLALDSAQQVGVQAVLEFIISFLDGIKYAVVRSVFVFIVTIIATIMFVARF